MAFGRGLDRDALLEQTRRRLPPALRSGAWFPVPTVRALARRLSCVIGEATFTASTASLCARPDCLKVSGQHLDRDRAIPTRVRGALHLPLSIGAERRLQFVGTESSPRFKSHDSLDSQHPTTWLLGYASCFLPAFLAAAHLFFIAKASRFRPSGLIAPRRGAAARFDPVSFRLARFAAQCLLVASMILLRPPGLRCLLRGWPLLLRVVTFAKGLFPATSRRADMARSMADRCVSS